MTHTPDAAIRSATVQPSVTPTSAILRPGNSRRRSRTFKISLARSTWTSSNCLPSHDRHQRRRIEPGQQHIVAARAARQSRGRSGGRAPRAARCGTGRIAVARANRRRSRRRPRPARRTGRPRARSTGVHVVAGIDHRTLPGEDALAGDRRDHRPGHAVGAADGDGRGLWIDRRRDVDCRAERAVAAVGVVRPVRAEVDLGQAEPREAGDDAGRNPFAVGIDHFRAARDSDAGPGRDDPAVTHHHRTAPDRLRPIAHDQACRW